MGRCLRRRNRRKKDLPGSILSDDVKALYKWFTQKGPGINTSSVSLRHFSDTGRGFMAKRTIKQGDLLISVPYEYFISTSLISKSPLKNLVERFKAKISPLESLSMFLLYERILGEKSDWFPYLDVLPTSFSMPMMWKENDLQYLPHWILTKVDDQKKLIKKSYQKIKSLLLETRNDFANAFTFGDFLWAWAVITSRSAYMPQCQEEWLNHEPNNYVLIPFLDMFNHTPSVKVEAGFNPISRCYEIRTLVAYKRFEQVYINYGTHDNAELLISYGFVCTRNPFDSICFTIDEVVNAAKNTYCLKGEADEKLKFIKTNSCDKNMLISMEGVSWSLLSAIRIFITQEKCGGKLYKLHHEGFIDAVAVQKVIHYLIANCKKLPNADDRSNSSLHVTLAKQLCLGFEEIISSISSS